ncbi:NtaA/DmoA family FMN-dependent monooxygenase [Mycolicibacterium mengxianglii]|uniref:NtaA/DmoA family FMN-dependent monooxygenase n=1 Tax=Mycolicibacterium mengxianglii TaxID=2736649 RepID=UPI0018D0C707|nr:NtaA/DmoA family FMN-dependent monooxygenase [Mycolicibacterium mengxianglii]
MSARPFHLGWFTNFAVPAWRGPFAGTETSTWMDGDFYVDMARSMERAGFDFIMLEDSLMLPDSYGGSYRKPLKYGMSAPKLDPVMLVPALSRETEHLGLVATMSTSFYPPFQVARTMATLDHLTKGRVGWNIVTSSEDRAAQNFGMASLHEHDERYDRAEEFTELVSALWQSWDLDAVVADQVGETYTDADKVHVIDFQGKFFASRGPLNVPPGPQGRPVICQAGSSDRGRDFAARYAEIILAVPTGLERMKAFRDDIRRRMTDAGRNPDDCKVLFIAEPILGATAQEAQDTRDRLHEATPENVERGLVGISTVTDIDFSQFALDEPLPTDLKTNGHQSSLKNFYSYGKTLRDVALTWLNHYQDPTLVGTPEQVAARMDEMMEFIGGDGFLIHGPADHGALSRRYISEVCDGLIPALQQRKLTRTRYDFPTLRENLLAF